MDVCSPTQDDRGFDIAGMISGLLPAVPGLITSIADAAKGGVSDNLLFETPYILNHFVNDNPQVETLEFLEFRFACCCFIWALLISIKKCN